MQSWIRFSDSKMTKTNEQTSKKGSGRDPVAELGDRVDVMEITGVGLTLSGPMDCNLLGSCPWNCLGKNTRAGCCFLLQGSSPPRNQSYCLLHLLHWQNSLPPAPPGKQGMQLDSKIFLNPGTLKPLKLFFFFWSLFPLVFCIVFSGKRATQQNIPQPKDSESSNYQGRNLFIPIHREETACPGWGHVSISGIINYTQIPLR